MHKNRPLTAVMRQAILFGALFLLLPGRCGTGWAQDSASRSDLNFQSSNSKLNESFRWAKEQALQYVRPHQEPIGPWYEAALPGRNAFCMRDVSHQTTGAAALGLHAANRNMLGRFADAVSASRDWAGYWEIDRSGKPSAADYVSDSDFWYNLPANFDVLDAILRMWRWTGDDSYRDKPAMRDFFRESMTNYIARWQLGPDSLLTRPRIANRRQSHGKFVDARGIPSYSEGPKDFIFGADLLAAEYRAMRSYQEIASSQDDKKLAAELQRSADQIQHILETAAWSPARGHFNGVIQKDLSGFTSGDTMVLYFDAIKDPAHVRGALDYVSNPDYWKKINIEEESYVPQVLFRYGRTEAAYQVLFDLSSPGKHRREYPEVSYAVVAAIVTGAMGIEPSHGGDDFDVQTLSQPPAATDTLSLTSLRIRSNLVNVTHRGETSTRFENREGASLQWRAAFIGDAPVLFVNGHAQPAVHGVLPNGAHISWVTVTVPSHSAVVVSQDSADSLQD
jgi:hypothetical protein